MKSESGEGLEYYYYVHYILRTNPLLLQRNDLKIEKNSRGGRVRDPEMETIKTKETDLRPNVVEMKYTLFCGYLDIF